MSHDAAASMDRARRAVIEMCPSNECNIRETCTRTTGACRLRPPLDAIAQSDRNEVQP